MLDVVTNDLKFILGYYKHIFNHVKPFENEKKLLCTGVSFFGQNIFGKTCLEPRFFNMKSMIDY
jgi:hypothetical protein